MNTDERIKELRERLGLTGTHDAPSPALDIDEALEFTALIFGQEDRAEQSAFLTGLISDPDACARIGAWLHELLDKRHGVHERRMKLVAVRGEERTQGTVFPVGADGRFMLVRPAGKLAMTDLDAAESMSQDVGMTVVFVSPSYGSVEVVELVPEDEVRIDERVVRT